MKRLSPDALEALAYAKGREIEVDNEQGIALVTVEGVTYYAQLSVERAS